MLRSALTALHGDESAEDTVLVPLTAPSEVTEKILEDFYLGCPGNKLFHVCDK
jgi:hypothetical protein